MGNYNYQTALCPSYISSKLLCDDVIAECPTMIIHLFGLRRQCIAIFWHYVPGQSVILPSCAKRKLHHYIFCRFLHLQAGFLKLLNSVSASSYRGHENCSMHFSSVSSVVASFNQAISDDSV